MNGTVVVWLMALLGIVVLARLRGWRGVKILLACLGLITLAVIVLNVVISSRAGR